MKNHRYLWQMSLLVFILFFLVFTQSARAAYEEQQRLFIDTNRGTELTQTPIPQQSTNPELSETPSDRILPPVGDNAAMVLGASLLVLIIIGGVMFSSQRKQKH
jgi:hypothetical protein